MEIKNCTQISYVLLVVYLITLNQVLQPQARTAFSVRKRSANPARRIGCCFAVAWKDSAAFTWTAAAKMAKAFFIQTFQEVITSCQQSQAEKGCHEVRYRLLVCRQFVRLRLTVPTGCLYYGTKSWESKLTKGFMPCLPVWYLGSLISLQSALCMLLFTVSTFSKNVTMTRRLWHVGFDLFFLRWMMVRGDVCESPAGT